ncbi:AAA family ATPase [Pedobacter sp.]|uniref:AAA family ATPase n=1 Tax=Pedobacter sp. TaxID=1411316 RepID=UPI00396CBBE7
MPFLSNINCSVPPHSSYPFNLPAFQGGIQLYLTNNVTFFVGENGSGKSTLLEAIAQKIGFNLRGGNRNHNLDAGINFQDYESPLTHALHFSWTPRKINNGFFMRAESFFNFADYIDEIAKEEINPEKFYQAYGGKSLHHQSHGESFLALFKHQFQAGIYILDEPEAALSPSRILSFMSIINRLENSGKAQFIIATHSPILLCYPNATIFNFEDSGIKKVSYAETESYILTKSFLGQPDMYLRHLFNENP